MVTFTNIPKSTDNDFIKLETGNFEYLLLETGDRIMLEEEDYNHFEFKTQRNTASWSNISRNTTSFNNISRN